MSLDVSNKKTESGAERQLGVEIEYAGVSGELAAKEIQTLFGGDIEQRSAAEWRVLGTAWGDFRVELDASYLKSLAMEQQEGDELSDIRSAAYNLITRASEQLVPWEIVAPPIGFHKLDELNRLIERLRELGAKGTRHSLQYAFGLHLNPDPPDLSTSTILRYFQAYLCLYDWICASEKIDTARKLTSYIKHFDKPYIEKVIAYTYAPDQGQLIDDYLAHNATRNRSMDMLPLFSYLDESRVGAVIEDKRVKARPSFHYRLPNCDIDNPQWSLLQSWQHWSQIERLANDHNLLMFFRGAYHQEILRMSYPLDGRWVKSTAQLLGED